MIGMIWAVAFDWLDGIVARKLKNRTKSYSSFGGQLDVLIDIVSYGVAPSILLLSYGELRTGISCCSLYYDLCKCIKVKLF